MVLADNKVLVVQQEVVGDHTKNTADIADGDPAVANTHCIGCVPDIDSKPLVEVPETGFEEDTELCKLLLPERSYRRLERNTEGYDLVCCFRVENFGFEELY